MAGLAGCGKENSTVTEPAVALAPRSEEEIWYERLRSGSVQIAAVVEAASEAFQEAERLSLTLKGSSKDAAVEIAEMVDGVGFSLSEANITPPDQSNAAADFKTWEGRRLKLIEEGSDAYLEIKAAHGLASSVQESDANFSRLAGILETVMTDLGQAIEALGGKPPAD